MNTTDFDIIIIGYGPAGATFANLMGRRGYRVGVFDQAATIYDKPRAITADQEVMRIFQECGLAEEIERTTSPHPGTDFVGIDGQIIKRFYPAPPPHLLAWEPTWMFVQPTLEATLRQGLERYPNVQSHLEHEFTSYIQHDDSVTAEFRRLQDGATVRYSARYLIGSDGGRSTVRRLMGSHIEDLAFDEWWIVVDAWLRGPVDLPKRCVQYCRPSRPGTYIVGPDNLRRWEIKLLPGESPDDFQNENAVRDVLSRFVDTRHLELCRTAIYRFHALVVDQWRQDRVFLMGDAAHQTPPFLGQGLCAGIRDAINLAWKIDGVERLGYSPRLLDTYTEERKPHVRTIVAHAKSFGLIIGELDEAAARVRDQELGEQLAAGRSETVRQKFIPNLETGFIAKHADGHTAPGAGDLFIQPWIVTPQGERRFDDLLPPGFLLVARKPEALDWLDANAMHVWQQLQGRCVLLCDDTTNAMQTHDALVVHERDGLLGHWFESLNAHIAVVRPDRYIFGVARHATELRDLFTQLQSTLHAASCSSVQEPSTTT